MLIPKQPLMSDALRLAMIAVLGALAVREFATRFSVIGGLVAPTLVIRNVVRVSAV